MTLPPVAIHLPRWFNTVKFKIVAVTVVTAVLAALSSVELAVTAARVDLQRVLLDNERNDGERMASLLSSKLETVQLTLRLVAGHVKPADWRDGAAMTQFLVDKPALGAVFGTVFAVRPDGSMLARVEGGSAAVGLPWVGDREYFKRAMQTDQPVVSSALLGRVTKAPMLVVAAPVVDAQGRTVGVIAGSLMLRSAGLFSNLSDANQRDAGQVMVIDRTGTLLAHPDAARVLGRAADEPGLSPVFERWRDAGSPIDTRGEAQLSGGYMVSMAGIPLSDWVLVRVVPESLALAPLQAADRTAWRTAIGVGLAAALFAGLLAWYVTRPITRLRSRARQLLNADEPLDAPWPRESGEIGQLSWAFQRVVEQRQARQRETQALLQQLEAVLDHAEVGIAFTRNGQFELVSRQFCRVFRSDKSRLVGQPTRVIYASDDAYEALSARALPAFMASGAFDGEVELLRGDGQRFWAHMRGRAVVPGDRAHGTIWTMDDVSEVREQRERLTWTSSHDSLTGLANRAAFEVLLEHASARAATEPFCALFIDLDRFKQVNDTGGHAAGDALLRDVAHLLAAQVRKSDTVARLGGDEFAVLLDHCPVSQAQVIAERMRSAVISYQLLWDDQAHSVGASIGLVPVDATLGTAADVLRAADAACYAAKRGGRNRVEMHTAA